MGASAETVLQLVQAGSSRANNKRKNVEVAQDPDAPAKEAKKPRKAPAKKGAAKKKAVDSDSDDAPNDTVGRSAHTKRGTGDADSLLKFCQRCLRKFVPEVDGEDTCTACLNIPKAGGGASRKISALKRRRAVLVDDLIEGSVLPLRDMCIKLIADNIDAVEAFGDIPDYVKRSISRILSRRRAINATTLSLFIGADQQCVELFDCARLKPDNFNQIILMSPNIHTLHLADCGQMTDNEVTGCFLVRDTAFETLLSGPVSKNLQNLFLENTAKFGALSIAALTTHCKELKTLCLSQCSAVGGEVVRGLSTLVGLTSLELMELGNSAIGKGLNKLSLNGCKSNLSPLKSLDLHRLYNLTDASVISIISHHGASLNRLVLNGLDDVTAHALKAVVEGCPSISDLDMSWVRSFNDDLFSAMVGRCKWLKSVKVYGCNLLTEFSLVKKFFNVEGDLIRVVGNEFD
ncbi:hypothetical protein BDR26DRAFT_857486 [Obelidium mucronatum]|nr:hypothetical protein BDR26DRAFT_857486 [Obelidium mucronatum]